jgi:penicillin G amidase
VGAIYRSRSGDRSYRPIIKAIALRLLSLLAIAPLAAADEPGALPLPTEPETVEYQVDGLEAPARIVVDRWGVPHIYAGTHYDAFFVQGFNAARDRLWQIDTWRRRGLGQLAEAFGPAYVEQDKAARLFLYRGDMYREWLAYGSDAKAIATAFTAGINAYVKLTETQPELLPPEFGLLDYRPARWAPEDVVRIRSHGLWRNVTAEVQRARIACEHGLPATRLWKVLEPAWEARIPDGLDPCSIPENVLDLYLLAKAPVRFDAARLATAAGTHPDRAALLAEVATNDLDRQLGSNNWVIAPTRTDTGRPILANDPHRAHDVPSLRYVAHLVAPGLNVIGAGEPSLPGISIGHNGTIAFGLTIFGIDQEDLYVYDKERNGYRHRGRIEPFEEVVEQIAVKGADAQTVRLRFTRHGPVVQETGDRAFAVRAAGSSPAWRPTSAAWNTCAHGTGASSSARSTAGARRRRTRCTPTSMATSATSRPACSRAGLTGTACCPCPATAASNGRASSTWMRCPWNTTPRAASSARPTT